MKIDNNNLILDLLNQVVITSTDGDHLEELHQTALENKKPFAVTYPLSKAKEENKSKLEELWAALGAACDYDLRIIEDAISEKMAEEAQRKEVQA